MERLCALCAGVIDAGAGPEPSCGWTADFVPRQIASSSRKGDDEIQPHLVRFDYESAGLGDLFCDERSEEQTSSIGSADAHHECGGRSTQILLGEKPRREFNGTKTITDPSNGSVLERKN